MLGVQPIQELVSFVLVDRFDRMIVSFDRAGIRSDYTLPLRLSDFVFADLKGFGDLNAMDGFLVGVAIDVACRATHHEVAGLNLDKLDANLIFEFAGFQPRDLVLSKPAAYA